MSQNIHNIVTQAQNIIATDIQTPTPPPSRSNGVPAGPAGKRKVRSKYKHVAAAHSTTRPSCLSHESSEAPSFLGFRNLMVLTIIVMNLRLVFENARKYGLLITLKLNLRGSDIRAGLILYLATPCFLFIAYVIERFAMERAKAAIGRRKKSDIGLDAPETEQERKDFRRTWWRIAIAHAINATGALLIASFAVYYRIHNPGIGTMCQLHAITVWLKTSSYAFTNRDLRHAMLHPGGPESALPDMYTQCPYPKNITLGNLCYFWWAPTLIYQPCYPRTERIRWDFFLKRVGETVALSVFIWLACAQYAEPLLRNSLGGMAELDLYSIAERLMKLSPISTIVWLAGFFALFQSFMNALAEITRFGDRQFYEDWWNSTNMREYWSTWNKPVYHFMRRHIYTPLVGRGWSHSAASIWVFVFSGFLHELAIGVPAHNILGVSFVGMVVQLPLIQLTEPLSKRKGISAKVLGNCIFWLNFVFIGQPLAAMIYFFAWQSKYGPMSSSAAGKGGSSSRSWF